MLGARVGQLSWCSGLYTIWGWDPFQAAPTQPSLCRILIRVVGVRGSYRLLSLGCSCSARSDGQDTGMDRRMRETRRLRSSAPCRLPGGTAARAAPQYYPLFLGLHRDGESHPRDCLGGRVTKVMLAPPTRPRPIRSPGWAPT